MSTLDNYWRGLDNPDRHAALPATGNEQAVPVCLDCETWCDASMPCRCCLAAEVDNLRAQLIALLAPEDPTYEELSARVQAVRAVADSTLTVDDQPGVRRGWDEAMSCVLRALDGGDE